MLGFWLHPAQPSSLWKMGCLALFLLSWLLSLSWADDWSPISSRQSARLHFQHLQDVISHIKLTGCCWATFCDYFQHLLWEGCCLVPRLSLVWLPWCCGCPSLQIQGLELEETEVQILPLLLTPLSAPRQNRQTCRGAHSHISVAEGNREDVCRAGFSWWPHGGGL